jgi:hypothetical protein
MGYVERYSVVRPRYIMHEHLIRAQIAHGNLHDDMF